MKKLTALCLAVLLVAGLFAGCGKDKETSEGESPSSIVTKKYTPNLLTGEKRAADYPVGQRPVAVMINNIKQALPQSGINSADLMYEMVTEGGITRMMGVYTDYKTIPTVGPVRSARDQHVQMMFPLEAVYLHIGGSTYASTMLEKFRYADKEIDGKYRSKFLFFDDARHQTRDSEHCWYTNAELLKTAVDSYSVDMVATENKTAFDFVNYDEPRRELPKANANGIQVRFSSYVTSTFELKDGKYYKSEFGKPQMDAADQAQLSFDNVFVLFTEITRYPDGILANVNLNWGGVGFYFNNGRFEEVRWIKGAPEKPLRIVGTDGKEINIKVNTGKSYVAMVSIDEYESFKIFGAGDAVVNPIGDATGEVEAAEYKQATKRTTCKASRPFC